MRWSEKEKNVKWELPVLNRDKEKKKREKERKREWAKRNKERLGEIGSADNQIFKRIKQLKEKVDRGGDRKRRRDRARESWKG